jgi:ribosomal protein S18 acetylase RimI-like enzyme
MELKSLGYQTELLFRNFEGEVLDHPDHLTIRTPSNPGYRWGNFLIFAEPPKAGDLERWKGIFAKEIGTPPTYTHVVFAWDSVNGEVGVIEPFIEAGFKLEKTAVMTAQRVTPPPKLNQDCTIRTFTNDDWGVWIDLEVATNAAQDSERGNDQGFRSYLEDKAKEYQGMIEAGLGQWFGAYLNGELTSSLGLFVWNKLGRFQMVATHPNYRRLGLAGTLVYHAARKGFEDMEANTLVMCADPEYVAIKIYASVGFRTTESIVGVDWHEK